MFTLICSVGCLAINEEEVVSSSDAYEVELASSTDVTEVTTVTITHDGKYAVAAGDYQNLHARVAIAYTLNGTTGIHITECVVNPNGVIVIPKWGLSGLKITGICVALVKTSEEVYIPTPEIIAMDFITFI